MVKKPAFAKTSILLRGVIVKAPLPDLSSKTERNFGGAIGAERVKDVNVIRPGNRLQTSREIQLFIPGENKDRNHCLSIPSKIMDLAIWGRRPTRAKRPI